MRSASKRGRQRQEDIKSLKKQKSNHHKSMALYERPAKKLLLQNLLLHNHGMRNITPIKKSSGHRKLSDRHSQVILRDDSNNITPDFSAEKSDHFRSTNELDEAMRNLESMEKEVNRAYFPTQKIGKLNCVDLGFNHKNGIKPGKVSVQNFIKI